LFKDRCDTLLALADWAQAFYADVTPKLEELAQHLTPAVQPAVAALAMGLADCTWDKTSINGVIKQVLADFQIKMPQLAMPVRVLIMGTAQTPSLDAVLELLQREKVLQRLRLP
jgi:glutamyl-tRNA synthetase